MSGSLSEPGASPAAARRTGRATNIAAKRRIDLAGILFLLADCVRRDTVLFFGIFRRGISRRGLLLVEDADIVVALALGVHAVDRRGQRVAILGNDAREADGNFSFFPVRA